MLVSLALSLALLAGCTGGSGKQGGPAALDRLGTAVTGVGTARSALLNAVQAVENGATSVDATDAICAKGHGVEARAQRRKGLAVVAAAGTAVTQFPSLVARYRAALAALDSAKGAVSGPPLEALRAVVKDGTAEATALDGFGGIVHSAWAQYHQLDDQERVWIIRAVTPWYRTDKEAADAYAVLVSPSRKLLTVARTQLHAASVALQGPTSRQAATLEAADAALTGLRGGS